MIEVTGQQVVYWKDALCQVVGTSEGKVVYLQVLDDHGKDKCIKCGHPQPTEHTLVEDSPLFQQNVKPVKTIEEQK